MVGVVFPNRADSSTNYAGSRRLYIAKAHFYDRFMGAFNPRQEKVIARLFEAGPEGFIGGLNANNYLAITKTSRATATRDLQDLVD